ncbi:MAG: hypothetical protein OEY24_07350 [Candidatus Bathyarchaeota archaeon]|nr:hypothetical protein [Candidatus Bathyarchaeota archaeon]MDH5495495.1 hypothetical protein [Candidatus Bathyarchaeota archaeon]
MLNIASISAVVAGAGVIVGVVFVILELRNLVITRQTDLVIRLYSAFGSRELQGAWEKVKTREYKNFNTYKKKYGLLETNEAGWFFEGLRVLHNRELIDIDLVDDLFSSPVKRAWERIKPIAEEMRRETQRPQIWEWFEYLYNEMKKKESKHYKHNNKLHFFFEVSSPSHKSHSFGCWNSIFWPSGET